MAIECSYCFNVNSNYLELRNYRGDGLPTVSYFCSADCLFDSLMEYMVSRKTVKRNDSLPAQM